MANLELKLFNTLLNSYDVLLKGSLVVLELSDLLLEASALCFLVSIMALDFLFNSVQLIGEGFASILLLHGQNTLQCLFLTS